MFSKLLSKLEESKYVYKYCNVVKPRLYHYYLNHQKKLGLQKKTRAQAVVVSLTTIPVRINQVWLTIASLMDQSVKPDKIILWLDTSFEDQVLPNELYQLQEIGLDIEFCADLKSHKKYYGTLKNYPDDLIITVDDDIFYPKYFIKMLMKNHEQYPHEVICYRAHKILFDGNHIKPYKQWNQGAPDIKGPSYLLIPTGVSGVLYPPHALYQDVLNTRLFLALTPHCDDLWLKIMEIKGKTQVRKVFPYSLHFPMIKGSQVVGLYQINLEKDNNDIELRNLLNYYSDIDLKNLE